MTDSVGGEHTDTVTVTIDATDPTANAGTARTVAARETVTLDGRASRDDESGIASYRWVQTSGTPNDITLTGADTNRSTFTAPDTAATLGFTLTVTDRAGNTGTAVVTITVIGLSTVDAGADQIVNLGRGSP